MKRFLTILLAGALFFIAGVLVGRFVMPRKVEITMIDIKALVEIIERYNELKCELDEIKEWNEQVIIEPEEEK